MIMRSVVSDPQRFCWLAGRSDWNNTELRLSLFYPFHATIGWTVGAYECRSSAASGFCGEWDILDDKFPIEKARICMSEMKENSKYWTGDYYPSTPWTYGP